MSDRRPFPDCEYLKQTDKLSPNDVFCKCTHERTDSHFRERTVLRRICKTCIHYIPVRAEVDSDG